MSTLCYDIWAEVHYPNGFVDRHFDSTQYSRKASENRVDFLSSVKANYYGFRPHHARKIHDTKWLAWFGEEDNPDDGYVVVTIEESRTPW